MPTAAARAATARPTSPRPAGARPRPGKPSTDPYGAYGAFCAALPSRPFAARGSQRDEVVLAEALQDEEGRRAVAAVGHQVRPSRRDGVRLAGSEVHLLLGIAQEQPHPALQDVEGVLGLVVVVPGHPLARRDLEFGDPEARALGMAGPALDLEQLAGVLH